MTDPVIDPKVDSNQPAPGTDPKPTETPGTEPDLTALDFSKLSQTQIDQLYANKSLYQHPRFKDLGDAKKERDQLAKERDEREKKKLEEEGKYKELLDKEKNEKLTLQEKLKSRDIDSAIERAAVKAGAVDSEVLLKLVDRSKITLDEATGQVSGVDEEIKALQDSKGYLFGKTPNPTLGNGTNPGVDTTGLKRFKKSQIDAMNVETYQKNEKDILASMRAGLVENDTKR